MKINQSFHRKVLRQLVAVSFVLQLAMGMTWAATDNPAASPAPAGAKTSGTARTATPASSKTAGPASKVPAPDASVVLPTIVVTAATRVAQTPDTTASTSTVLTHQFLEDNKFAFVSDALQAAPGLSIVSTGMPGSQTSIFIHGLSTYESLLTVDGRRQSDGLFSSFDNLANLTLDNVDQIEVVRSPISSAQGGGAMGGVINVVTLSGKGVATPEGSVSEEAGSFNTFKESAQSRGSVGNFDYAIGGSRQDSIYPALSTGSPGAFGSPGFAGQADQYRNNAFRGNFGYQITPDIYLDLHSAYNDAYSSVTGEFSTPDPTANLLIEDWFLSPEIVAKVADFYTTKFYYTHDQQRQAYVDPYNEQLYGGQGNLTRTQINTNSIDWQNDLQIAHNWSLTAGLQGDNRDFSQYDNGLGIYNFQGHNDNIGGYVSSQWQPLPGLNILNSGRYDNYSQFVGAFSWRQAVAYTVPATQTALHASVSRAYTPPPLQDLYLSDPAFEFYANPNLVPETDLGWEAGVKQPFWDGRITPGVTYFHNDVKNDIQAVTQTNGSSMEENINRVTTDGVEVELALKPCATVTANIGYTYLNAVNDTAQTRLERVPRNEVTFTGVWKPIDALTLTLGGNWVVGREDSNFQAPFGEVNSPDYFTLRASATYRINDHVSIWVRGENLTDRNYQEALGYYAPSIAGYGGIKISF
jgi:vitamin B12 transporter